MKWMVWHTVHTLHYPVCCGVMSTESVACVLIDFSCAVQYKGVKRTCGVTPYPTSRFGPTILSKYVMMFRVVSRSAQN